MALSVGTIQHAEVVAGFNQTAVHDLGLSSDSSRCVVPHLRIFPFWLGRIVLAWRHSNGLLPPRTVLREQSPASSARTARGRRFESEHLVARSSAGDGMGRKLARQSSLVSGV